MDRRRRGFAPRDPDRVPARRRGQLEQLIAHPSETPAHIGRWLNLVATLRIQQGKEILIGLSKEFPKNTLYQRQIARLH